MSRSDANRKGKERARTGTINPTELAEEFQASARMLWLVAVGIVQDAALAEDVVQDAGIVALEKLDQFQPGTNLTAWIAQIVRHLAMNQLRKERRRRSALADARRESRQSGTASIASGADPLNPEHLLEHRQMDEQILRALNEVDETARACLLLRTLEGLAYSRIAALLEIPEGTAMSHVHRTRRFLRERLVDLAPNDPPDREAPA